MAAAPVVLVVGSGLVLKAMLSKGCIDALTGQLNARLPVKVRGSVESPKVYPDVVGLAKAQVVDRAKGLLDGLLNHKKSGGEAK